MLIGGAPCLPSPWGCSRQRRPAPEARGRSFGKARILGASNSLSREAPVSIAAPSPLGFEQAVVSGRRPCIHSGTFPPSPAWIVFVGVQRCRYCSTALLVR
jgi:hypothetical protein